MIRKAAISILLVATVGASAAAIMSIRGQLRIATDRAAAEQVARRAAEELSGQRCVTIVDQLNPNDGQYVFALKADDDSTWTVYVAPNAGGWKPIRASKSQPGGGVIDMPLKSGQFGPMLAFG